MISNKTHGDDTELKKKAPLGIKIIGSIDILVGLLALFCSILITVDFLKSETLRSDTPYLVLLAFIPGIIALRCLTVGWNTIRLRNTSGNTLIAVFLGFQSLCVAASGIAHRQHQLGTTSIDLIFCFFIFTIALLLFCYPIWAICYLDRFNKGKPRK